MAFAMNELEESTYELNEEMIRDRMDHLGPEIELKVHSNDTATRNQHTSVMVKSIVSMEYVYSLYFVGDRYELDWNPMLHRSCTLKMSIDSNR